MKIDESFVNKETADFLNDSKWARRDFIFLKKTVPGKHWPISGFLFFDDRRTVYDADKLNNDDINDLVPDGLGPNDEAVYRIVRKPGAKLDREKLPLIKRYDSTADMVRDGWMVD